ncbi:hypothetical protein AX15_001660 [Amanita polypyramis BW_CC]|nr:hypothetical protein AX15_001660 [Amanita polypyramis BW_CC]
MQLPARLLVLGISIITKVTATLVGAQSSSTPFSLITDPASYVLPFIGTTDGGNTFPGATRPHGMAKPGMDTNSPHNQAGYDADPEYAVTGFSQLHDDGTGGAASLSNFKIFPIKECPSFSQCHTAIDSRPVARKTLPDGSADDYASPGYFSSNLTNGIRVELAATRRTALHRYTFPAGTTEPRLLVDILNDGQKSGQNPVMTLDPNTAQVKGGASFQGSFGPGGYKAYTCVTFKGDGYDLGKPVEHGAYAGDRAVNGTTNISQVPHNGEMGALFTFKPAPGGGQTTILVRVGVSLISSDQACLNAEQEIPDYNFDTVHNNSRAQWNDILGRIQVDTTGIPLQTVQLFYTSLYRVHISPADYTGENPKWQSTEPYYDSLYCNWDTYRTLYPLMSLHDPVTFSRIVRGMIDIQKHEGWLPECRGATVQQWVQGGSHGDPILAEFFVKFSDKASELGVTADSLYNALLADAEQQASDWDLQGRQVDIWKSTGYLPYDTIYFGGSNTRQVSRALEYAFDDFAISQVAKALGKQNDTSKYLQRAGNFINNWNASVSVPGYPDIKGMMQLRGTNGSWGYTDPRHCSIHDPTHSTCYLNADNKDGFYEGSPIIYSQYVPQDTAKLIQLQGGLEKFISRLDFIFEQGYFDPGDEPSQQMPFMYHYANRPGLSTQRSRQILAQYYNTTTDGIPGNDDSGAMASYPAFFLAGMYPLPATRQFLLSSPYFPQISFYNPVYNSTTVIKSTNFQGNPASGTGGRVFVQSVTVNGQAYKSNCYLDWDVFTSSSVVELTLTDNINVTCGDGESALPPSISTGGYN